MSRYVINLILLLFTLILAVGCESPINKAENGLQVAVTVLPELTKTAPSGTNNSNNSLVSTSTPTPFPRIDDLIQQPSLSGEDGDSTVFREQNALSHFCDNSFDSSTFLTWSPDGQFITFLSSDSQLYFLDFWKTFMDEAVAISQPIQGSIREFAWSPDSQHIAFTRGSNNPHLYMWDLGKAQETQITNLPSNEIYAPTWSPSNPEIMFAYGMEGIKLVDLANKAIIDITEGRVPFAHPSWSPDGNKLAYTLLGQYRNDKNNLYVESRLNEQLFTFTTDETSCNGFPKWSPQGENIAFLSAKNHTRDLFIANINSSSLVNLTHGETFISSFDWSPDGEWLVYVSGEDVFTDDETWGVFVINIDGTRINQVLDTLNHEYLVQWSPNGEYLALLDYRHGADLPFVDVIRLEDNAQWQLSPTFED